ncbi:MAG: 16S rRNA (cytidine(1402)-2'-O)-methyltransferase [Clostridia bacterium]|nr:16S rRNA (cytidine(1402)-2'-O)-methyltransferase [Clostridia bacterium]
MQGMLFLCATPIGNLEDISAHVLRTLAEADLIAAEDTRNSIKILNKFEINTPMTSYHEYNKFDKAKDLIRQIKEGKNVALITDAGTPAISDPGEILVKMCYEEQIKVTSLPGPCACITALTLSGLATRRFCFEGFLPHDKKEKQMILTEIKNDTRTHIFYEAPHHLCKTLNDLYHALGEREITVCRELTKKYETVYRMNLSSAITFFSKEEPKGEFVIVVQGRDRAQLEQEAKDEWNQLTIEEHMQYYLNQNIEKKEAMKFVAKDRGISKRDIYQALL